MDKITHAHAGRDIWYRVRRGNRIVHVYIDDASIIPREDDRAFFPAALAHLQKLEHWDDASWHKLVVHRGGDGHEPKCEIDASPAHTIPHALLQKESYPVVYDVSDLVLLRRFKPDVWDARRDQAGHPCVLKLAAFPFQIPWMIPEIEAYHVLARGCPVAPKLLGYVFESQDPDRIVGFLIEKLEGRRYAEPGDLPACQRALQTLHQYVIHGDCNKYNILVSESSGDVQFVDFGNAIPVGSPQWTAEKRDQEMASLPAMLADTSGRGRPPRLYDEEPE